MNPAPAGERWTVWTLWAAAGLAVVGGVMPFVFGGSTSRLDGVIIPFWIGAAALAACAAFRSQGRTVTSVLYFVAGLAIAFGLLSMFSLPVRLAALGSCAAPPAPCTTGLPRPLTDGENNGMGAATAFGIVAILLGFYGLVTLFRRPEVEPAPPPVRTIPPMAPPQVAEPEPKPKPEPKLEPEAEPEPEPGPAAATEEAPAQEEPELPAHEEEELPELPPHESTSPTT